MSKAITPITDALYSYVEQISQREPEILRRLRDETVSSVDMAYMQVSALEGQFLGLLTELTGAKRYLELGAFTGYSALCVALAMPRRGHIVSCDVMENFAAVAKRYWAEAEVDQMIDFRLQPAGEVLDALLTDGQEESFDLVFIDADKELIESYYEKSLALTRSGGLVLIDNVLWRGKVADPAHKDAKTQAFRSLNEALLEDQRISLSLLPFGDGLTLARKR